jgi:hypothetical protein
MWSIFAPALTYLPIADTLRLSFAYTESMASQDARHQVYMSFQCRNGWHCQFLE